MKSALLPAGLRDQLPPLAEHEEEITRALLDRFASYGYQRVKPPLVEFEEGLLNGVGAAVATQTFRLMDPVSQRMMGVRADITPQIARIATTRLKGAPRPLRLSYGGEVLRVKGNQLRPERGFRQVGVELVGAAKAAMGDAEVILLAAEALREIQIESLSVDRGVVVAGDFNMAFIRPGDRDTLLAFRKRLGLRDAGAAPELPFWRERDFVLYRDGPNVVLTPVEVGEATEFVNGNRALSDHAALFARFVVGSTE